MDIYVRAFDVVLPYQVCYLRSAVCCCDFAQCNFVLLLMHVMKDNHTGAAAEANGVKSSKANIQVCLYCCSLWSGSGVMRHRIKASVLRVSTILPMSQDEMRNERKTDSDRHKDIAVCLIAGCCHFVNLVT